MEVTRPARLFIISTTRRLRLGDETALLTDTVGFVRKLPHDLVETFRSTLGAAACADCVLEVVDASAPDWREHIEVARKALEGIVEEGTPRLLLFNKTDLCGEERIAELRAEHPEAILASVRENAGLDLLRRELEKRLAEWHAARETREREEEEAAYRREREQAEREAAEENELRRREYEESLRLAEKERAEIEQAQETEKREEESIRKEQAREAAEESERRRDVYLDALRRADETDAAKAEKPAEKPKPEKKPAPVKEPAERPAETPAADPESLAARQLVKKPTAKTGVKRGPKTGANTRKKTRMKPGAKKTGQKKQRPGEANASPRKKNRKK